MRILMACFATNPPSAVEWGGRPVPKTKLKVVEPQAVPPIERLVQDYLQHLHALGRAPKTREAY